MEKLEKASRKWWFFVILLAAQSVLLPIVSRNFDPQNVPNMVSVTLGNAVQNHLGNLNILFQSLSLLMLLLLIVFCDVLVCGIRLDSRDVSTRKQLWFQAFPMEILVDVRPCVVCLLLPVYLSRRNGLESGAFLHEEYSNGFLSDNAFVLNDTDFEFAQSQHRDL